MQVWPMRVTVGGFFVVVFVVVPLNIWHIISMVMIVMQVCVRMAMKVNLSFMVVEMAVGLPKQEDHRHQEQSQRK